MLTIPVSFQMSKVWQTFAHQVWAVRQTKGVLVEFLDFACCSSRQVYPTALGGLGFFATAGCQLPAKTKIILQTHLYTC